jgi:hypothetical protein
VAAQLLPHRRENAAPSGFIRMPARSRFHGSCAGSAMNGPGGMHHENLFDDRGESARK